MSPWSHALHNMSSFHKNRCRRHSTSWGLDGSVDLGPRVRCTRSIEGGVGSRRLSNMAVTVTARSSGPVASGRPHSRKLLRRLRSSISSKCSCISWDSTICEAFARSRACTRVSSAAVKVSPVVTLSEMQLRSHLLYVPTVCLLDA